METNLATGRARHPGNIMLIGAKAPVADLVKRSLAAETGAACHVWECEDDEQALDLLSVQSMIPLANPDVDAVIMDLTSPGVEFPKEQFLKTRNSIPSIPLIVLTDRTDFSLALFAMEQGAADSLSPWQLKADPDRLRIIILSCLARETNFKAALHESAAHVEDARRQGAAALLRAEARHEAVLRYFQDRGAIELKRLGQENESLRGELGKDAILLKETKNRNSAVLRHVQQRSALDLKEAGELNKKLLTERKSSDSWLPGG